MRGSPFPFLLIGCLSMFFAEVLSGASKTWFIDMWGLLVTFPLYLSHVLFFLWIALKLKKTSLPQLYFFGVIFALYESWITKVLWAGYPESAGPGLGTVLGLGIAEFPILVFFWHPVASFILPVLVFEILTKKILGGHESILRKTAQKTALVILFLILISTFLANGNRFDTVSANLSLLGTLLLILGFYYLSGKTDFMVFGFGKTGFVVVAVYLFFLYLGAFFLLLPGRIPKTALPYISIMAVYAMAISLILKSKTAEIKLMALNKDQYSRRDLVIFAIITIFAVNAACMKPEITWPIFGITYSLLSFIGVLIVAPAIDKTLK